MESEIYSFKKALYSDPPGNEMNKESVLGGAVGVVAVGSVPPVIPTPVTVSHCSESKNNIDVAVFLSKLACVNQNMLKLMKQSHILYGAAEKQGIINCIVMVSDIVGNPHLFKVWTDEVSPGCGFCGAVDYVFDFCELQILHKKANRKLAHKASGLKDDRNGKGKDERYEHEGWTKVTTKNKSKFGLSVVIAGDSHTATITGNDSGNETIVNNDENGNNAMLEVFRNAGTEIYVSRACPCTVMSFVLNDNCCLVGCVELYSIRCFSSICLDVMTYLKGINEWFFLDEWTAFTYVIKGECLSNFTFIGAFEKSSLKDIDEMVFMNGTWKWNMQIKCTELKWSLRRLEFDFLYVIGCFDKCFLHY